MLNRLLLAFVALLMVPSTAVAESLEGSWALRIDGTTIFRFDLRQTGEGGWQGVWTRPRTYHNNGVIFSALVGRYEAMSRDGRAQGDAVRLTFDDPRPRSLPETFRFRVTGEGTAELTFVDAGFTPFPLVRVAQDAEIGPFVEDRLYDRDNAQTAPTQLAVPARAVPARAVPAPPKPPEPEPEPDQELPAVAPAALPPAPRAPEPEAWQPDPAVSAAIAARAATFNGSPVRPHAAPEPDLPAAAPAAPPPAPTQQQTGAWQPDPSVSAAVAARAAALEGAPLPPAEVPEAKPESRVGADFLDGL